jgi:hypothetical protein
MVTGWVEVKVKAGIVGMASKAGNAPVALRATKISPKITPIKRTMGRKGLRIGERSAIRSKGDPVCS